MINQAHLPLQNLMGSNEETTEQPKVWAWVIIGCFIGFALLCLAVGAGSILRLIFPLLSLSVGLALFFNYPQIYIAFACWMWFLTPLLARIIEMHSGWDQQKLMLAAPCLVTHITLVTFFKKFRWSLSTSGGLLFLLVFTSIFYGLCVALPQNSPAGVGMSLIQWVTPLLFGFHMFASWRSYDLNRKIMGSVFLWGVLIMGGYGIIQYVFAPEWDRAWLANSGMLSIGNPAPFEIRVWSTLNSPGPFSMAMMAGLLLLFTMKGSLRFPAAAAGFVALLLSLDRTAWGAWGLAFIIFLVSLKAAKKVRIVVASIAIGLGVFFIAASPPFNEIIAARLQTLTDIKGDGSFSERVDIYKRGIGPATHQFFGYGLGREEYKDIFDSGILDMILTLGWPGAICYLSGLFGLIGMALMYREGRVDLFMNAARAISVGIVATIILSDALLQVTGVILWGLLGMALAGHEYHKSRGFANIESMAA